MTNNKTYFVANWKMYGNSSSVSSINKVISLSKTKKFKKVRIVYCPPYTLLNQFKHKTKKSRISIGAQNCHAKNDYGANTGSINTKMIKSSGCKFVILGHSESRETFSDTNYDLKIKVNQVLSNQLKEDVSRF